MSENSLAPMRADTHFVEQLEHADVLAERRLVHRVVLWVGILVPIGAGFFAGLVLVATRIVGVASGGPVAMGAGIGVLSGVFFGM